MMANEPIRFPKLNGLSKAETCGDCAHFQVHPKDASIGTCHGNPPIIAFMANGPTTMRPGVSSADLACHLHKPR